MVGLGTGSLACYARPGDDVRIYEIDPAVVRLAQEYFSALRTCTPDATIASGDARLLLDREQVRLDILALDAFTSDAIPVHLLTLEAFRIYLRTLAPDGVIAVHISNRHLDLELGAGGAGGTHGPRRAHQALQRSRGTYRRPNIVPVVPRGGARPQ